MTEICDNPIAQTPKQSGLNSPDLNDRAFERISRIARREAGLAIPGAKSAMVRTRLARRLRILQLADFESYCDLLEGDQAAQEMTHLISALTTNVSHFFREPHHFELFEEAIVPQINRTAKTGEMSRIWSAGCANGQEPYSIAMTLAKHGLTSTDVRILATDIDPIVLSTASAGSYPDHMMGGVTRDDRQGFFSADGDVAWRINDDLRDMVAFNCLNLLDTWPITHKLDAIFCRNVVIYFDKPTQRELWHRFASVLKTDGVLFLGHSERIDGDAEPMFSKFGITAYRRAQTQAPLHKKGR